MSARVANNSLLKHTDLLSADGLEFWDMVDLPEIPPQPGDIQYQVTDVDRIDLLATAFYGDPVFQWVIAGANNLEILPTDLQVGAILRIPDPDFVLNSLPSFAKV